MGNKVLYEVADKVAVITLNRPEKRNALNAAIREGLWEAWRRFEADDTARVAILTGAGDKAFCAGVDLTEMSVDRRGVPPADFMPDLGRNIEITKPTNRGRPGHCLRRRLAPGADVRPLRRRGVGTLRHY